MFPPGLPAGVTQGHGDCDKDDHPAHDHLVGDLETHENEPVVQHPHHKRAKERTDDRALATVQRGSADNDGGNHRHQIGLAERVFRRLQASRIEKPGKAGGRTAQCQHHQADPGHPYSRDLGGAGVVADCQHMGAKAGMSIEDMTGGHRGHCPDHERWNAKQLAGTEEAGERVVDHGNGAQVGH